MRDDTILFTIVQDEATWLPKWLAYYQPHVPIVIYDHDSQDDTVAIALQAGVSVIPLTHPYSCDWDWYAEQTNRLQAEWFKTKQRVLFATPDEFLVPDPVYFQHLGAYLDTTLPMVVHAMGYHVLDCGHYGQWAESSRHLTAPLRLDQPVLTQRCCWWRDTTYDKPLILSRPVEWVCGVHGAWELERPPLTEVPRIPDGRLFLIHLHRADYALTLQRHERIANRTLSKNIVPSHDYLRRGKDYDDWFYDKVSQRETIPARLRACV